MRSSLCNVLFGALVLVVCTGAPTALAQPQPVAVIFENVRVFDGTTPRLSAPSNVLVEGNTIRSISTAPIADPSGATVQRIRGGGRTLMPGLIDAHWHTMMAATPLPVLLDGDIGYLTLLAADQARATLLRGFTTVRDLGGPSFALKRAIDQGLTPGPRIYPSGAMITITGGHGDFRSPSELPRSLGGPLTRGEQINGYQLADSPDEARMRSREQLLMGASQIKLTAGGGVSSPHSPLDVSTFDDDELRAAVQAAANWGTYVTVHAYTPEAIQRAVNAGVKVIEHAHLIDEASAKLMADKGVWLSFQPFIDDPATPRVATANPARLRLVQAGTERAVELARKHRLKMGLGSDILFSAGEVQYQGAVVARMGRWHKPAEVLTMLTATNGELLQLSGRRNPYPGKLGVVQEGALADLLLVDGDPLAELNLIADPARRFVVIMKDGQIHKNALTASSP